MTAPQTPFLLIDNKFDGIVQYALATITTSSEVTGREGRRIGSYRRDRQVWQPIDDGSTQSPQGNWVRTALGTGITGTTSAGFIDRGHNLWGKTIRWQGSTDGGATWTAASISRAVPALNSDGTAPIGGDPTSAVCVTEEGALWMTWPVTAACGTWQLFIPYVASFVPVVPTALLGLAYQLLGFCRVFDDDAATRKLQSEESDAGWRASGTIYTTRTAELQLSLIGAADYDGQIRLIRTLMFARGCPALLCWDWGTRPERAGLFEFDGSKWGFGVDKVYRSGTIPLRELYARTTY